MVSYETVRRWVNHFGPIVAADLRKRRPKPVYDQKPQGERLRPCAGDQVRLTHGKHGIRGRGACKRGVHRFRSGHPQILGQEAAEMAGARTFVFVRRAPAYRDRPTPALRSTMAFWISTAQRTASTTERNSTRRPVAGTAGGGPSMRRGGRIDRPPRQALRARSHWDHALAARVATAR